MIEMWDEIFGKQNPKIQKAFEAQNGPLAFELMHQEMDKVWEEVARVTIEGGIACINIGDATRTINKNFALYSNHTRIIQKFLELGFQNLPNILWRKATNSPTKFMGAGMLAPGAYVTLEHEYILIFRKGNKRNFKTEKDKKQRRASAYFWEERNTWFSDLWDLKGTKQKIQDSKTRERSAAYPFELSYRLINMFSIKNDNILDPFLGTGTTTLSAMISERNSYGFDIDPILVNSFFEQDFQKIKKSLNKVVQKRLENHQQFVKERKELKGEDTFKHASTHHHFPVMTAQEKEIQINLLEKIKVGKKNSLSCEYTPINVTKKLLV